MQTIMQLCGGRVPLEYLAAGRHPSRCLVTAAAGSRPQHPSQPPAGQPGAEPFDVRRRQQAARSAHSESIKQQWQVKRTALTNFPEETQRHILSGGIGGSKAGGSPGPAAEQALALQARPLTTSAHDAAGDERTRQAVLQADLEKLLSALDYERRAGYVNVVGRIEQVPVADWAGRQLLHAAEQLQADAAAARGCWAAAQRLQRYGPAPTSERQEILQAAQAAAEQALRVAQAAGRTMAGRQARHAPQPAQAQQAGQQGPGVRPTELPSPPQAASPRSATSTEQQQPAAAAAAAAAAEAPAPAASTAAGIAPPGAAVPDPAELDAAAEQAHEEESGQQAPTPEGEEYVMRGNRRIKASTAAFHQSFAEAAAALEQAVAEAEARGGQAPVAALQAAGGEQRTNAWLRLRERRLTASAFSKAIGLFDGDRQQLWGEKVGMVEPFKGNDATAWGTSAEPRALAEYTAITGQHVSACMFKVRHEDPIHGWLGASPDGLIESLALDPASTGAAAAGSGSSGSMSSRGSANLGAGGGAAASMQTAGLVSGEGRGILEIKCPYNRGQPELAVPPRHATWYYMPQVQGLMYIFDCEWCNLYIWTPQRGSAVYHIRRDRQYWAQLWDVLADFWWSHVVPARQEFQAGRWEEVEQYRPTPKIESTEELRQWSKRMAVQAPTTFFGPPAGTNGRR